MIPIHHQAAASLEAMPPSESGDEGVEEDLLQCESLGRVPLEHMVD